MTFRNDAKFFFTDFHKGAVNLTLHGVSAGVLLWGLSRHSVGAVLVGSFGFDELGHVYNYFVVQDRDPRYGLRMLPYELLFATPVMVALLKRFDWF